MKAPVLVVLAIVLAGGCVHDALVSVNPSIDPFPGASRSQLPSNSPLAREIADGYKQYGVPLAQAGAWTTDHVYGVRWCPNLPASTRFFPYISFGHWAPGEDIDAHAGMPSALPGAVWVNTGPLWGDVTTHHGWWVNETDAGPNAQWCWIPGTSESPARVLWRTGEGFVAWAPEPPLLDLAEDEDDLLDWVFEFVGTLFEDTVDDYLLQGDAGDSADIATSKARRRERQGEAPTRVGPTKAQVTTARGALSEYVTAHPTVGSGVGTSERPPASSGAEHMHLPPARVIYGQMAREREGGEVAPAQASRFLPVISASGGARGEGGWSGGGFTRGSSHGAAGAGCASCRGTSSEHSSSSHSSGGGGGGHSSVGHSGGGGDCGSHSAGHK